jgi:ATP-dependent Clp protease ATP-binding subunit ClpA
MTVNRRAKRAIRSRMAQSGEKYTEARRALVPPAPPNRAFGNTTDLRGDDAIGWFTDQAYNAILLAEDEARMLDRPQVEPEHLLLAAARYGNVQRLLIGEGIVAGAIHAVIVRMDGFGDELVLGRVPRSGAGEAVLARSIEAAAARGTRSPSTEDLLLGLVGADTAMAVLRELGLADVTGLVEAAYPVTRPPLDPGTIARYAVVARDRSAPRPGPMPPVFERFTVEGRGAIEAAIAGARALKSEFVTPTHVLIALLGVERGAIASVRDRHRDEFDALRQRATELLAGRPSRPTTIFSAFARRLVAEGALEVAHRLGQRSLTTRHLFIAALESADPQIAELRLKVHKIRDIAAEIAEAPPGDEHA